MSYPTGATIQAYNLHYSDAGDDELLAMSERVGREMLAKLDELLLEAKYLEARIHGTDAYVESSDALSDRAAWWSCLRQELEQAAAEAKRLAHGESLDDMAAKFSALLALRRMRVRGSEVVEFGR